MATTLQLEIVTPHGAVYAQDVELVVLPARDGELGILPQHTPLITLLGQGELVARKGAREDRFLITTGVADVTAEKVSILTVFATAEDAIDEKKAEEARKRAEARLQEKLSPEETAMVQAALAHSVAQLNIKRRPRR
jgi:F-type H+-transporting ATPase subunit epsilon